MEQLFVTSLPSSRLFFVKIASPEKSPPDHQAKRIYNISGGAGAKYYFARTTLRLDSSPKLY
jgi:hypothetical protein